MSHIFDALQRSEAERPGTAVSTHPVATELLRVAERRMITGAGTHAAAGSSPTEDSAGPFGEFQSLPISLAPQSRLICLTDSGSPAAEAFRLLGVRLRHLRRDRTLKKVLITSTIPQEGKSMVAANLACTLALKTQSKVMLLEGDLRRPSLSQMFGLARKPGLSEWLQDEVGLTESIHHLEAPGLWILPAGDISSNPLELLQSGKLPALMEQLGQWFDWIVIDSPPVLPLADTSVWMRLADGVLLITRQGITEKRQLKRGLEAVEPKKLIGALLNGSTNSSDTDYYYSPPAGPQQHNTSPN
jgi:capsular exopolysaccharide synthesis family protein